MSLMHFCTFSKCTVVETQNAHYDVLGANLTFVCVLTLGQLAYLTCGGILPCPGCMLVSAVTPTTGFRSDPNV